MNEAEKSKLIGQYVLSPKFGLGIVTSIDKIAGDKDFLVIESENGNIKNFEPLESNTGYRFISTKERMNKLIKFIKENTLAKDFENKQARINYFKSQSKIQTLENIEQLICELKAIDDRGTVEEQTLTKLIDTLSIELSLVNEMTIDQARASLKNLINGEEE